MVLLKIKVLRCILPPINVVFCNLTVRYSVERSAVVVNDSVFLNFIRDIRFQKSAFESITNEKNVFIRRKVIY